MTALIKRVSVSEPYLRSGRQARFFLRGRRILFCRRALRAITRAGRAALLETSGVELSAHYRVLDADVLHAAAAEHHHRVFLQIVPFSGDVGGNLHPVRESHTGDLTNSRVRLTRRLGGHLGTHAALEWRRIKGRSILESIKTAGESGYGRLRRFVLAPSLGELIDGGHLR